MRENLLANSLKLAATLTAPGLARCFVEHELRAWTVPDDIMADAKVIVSELVTNSVEFTGFARPNPTYVDLEHVALLGVQVRVQGRSLFVEVWDNGKASLYPPPLRGEDEHGRGLFIVSTLAANMGHVSRGDGELVWAELAMGPEFTARLPLHSALTPGYRPVIAQRAETTAADMAFMSRIG